MLNIYPAVSTRWLDFVAHLFDRPLENETSFTQQETHALSLFRQFLALKVAIPFAFSDGIYWPLNLNAIFFLLIIFLVGSSRFYLLALFVILTLSFYDILYSWPFTINHQFLEFVIILLMCLTPDSKLKSTNISCVRMIKILMLSVWFFSGIHKLFDGYFLNAEFFALEAMTNGTTLGNHLNKILGLVSSLSAPCCSHTAILFTPWQAGFLLGLAWMTIIVEIFLPLSLLIPVLKHFGIFGLFIFQGIIAYFSGEIDFAFSAFAILFLFIPRTAPWTYPALAFLFLMVKPWI